MEEAGPVTSEGFGVLPICANTNYTTASCHLLSAASTTNLTPPFAFANKEPHPSLAAPRPTLARTRFPRGASQDRRQGARRKPSVAGQRAVTWCWLSLA